MSIHGRIVGGKPDVIELSATTWLDIVAALGSIGVALRNARMLLAQDDTADFAEHVSATLGAENLLHALGKDLSEADNTTRPANK